MPTANQTRTSVSSPFADFRLTPHYPRASPLDAIFSKVEAGRDEFVTEKYAEEIEESFEEWGKSLRQNPPGIASLGQILLPIFRAASFRALKSIPLRGSGALQVFRNQFASELSVGRDAFIEEVSEASATLPSSW